MLVALGHGRWPVVKSNGPRAPGGDARPWGNERVWGLCYLAVPVSLADLVATAPSMFCAVIVTSPR